MERLLKVYDMTEAIPETAATAFSVYLASIAYDGLGFVVLVLAAFFWTLRIKREIQQQYHNKVINAIKSLFKKWYRYGGDGKGKN